MPGKSSLRALLFVIALCAALAVLPGACGQGDNTLTGSIGQTHPLGFDTVTLRQIGASYRVTYLRGAQTVCGLIYTAPPATPPQPGQTITLDFKPSGNAALTRATSDQLMFPAADSGTLTFDVDLSEGATVSGRFGVRFAGGQAMQGTFAAPLTRAMP